MNKIEKLILLVSLILHYTRPGEAVNPSAGVRNCLRFRQHERPVGFPVLQRIVDDPILDSQNVLALMGGRKDDCDDMQGLRHVMKAIHLSDFSEKIFRVCIGTDRQYQISFDFRNRGSTVLGSVFRPLHTAHINLSDYIGQSRGHSILFHETLHVFFSLIRERLSSNATHLITPEEMFNDFHHVLSEGSKKLDLIYHTLRYDAHPSLTSREILNNVRNASQDIDQYSPILDMYFEETESTYQKILNNESLTISDIEYLIPVFNPINLTIHVKHKKMINKGVEVFLECEDPLYVSIRNLRKRFLNILTEYAPSNHDEEMIIAIFELLPPGVIKMLFPGFVETMEQYADTMLNNYPLQPIFSPRGEDTSYYYQYSIDLYNYKSLGFDKLNIDQSLDLASQVITHQDKYTAYDAIDSIEQQLTSDHGLPRRTRSLARMYLAELYYLIGDKIKASNHYKYLEKEDREFLFNPHILGYKTIDHYIDCQDNPSAKKMTHSLQRAMRGF